jgi:hypothetical protein
MGTVYQNRHKYGSGAALRGGFSAASGRLLHCFGSASVRLAHAFVVATACDQLVFGTALGVAPLESRYCTAWPECGIQQLGL